jgi:hypothetical protein
VLSYALSAGPTRPGAGVFHRRHSRLAPYEGESLHGIDYPGLKPWAESSGPFGTNTDLATDDGSSFLRLVANMHDGDCGFWSLAPVVSDGPTIAPRRVCCIRIYQMNEYLLFFIGMALMVMAPGPDFMNVVGQSLRGNLRTGVMSAIGAGAGLCVHVSAAILGLSAILLSSAFAYEAVRWVGAAYLIYLGIRALLSRSRNERVEISPNIFGQTAYRPSLSKRISGQCS